MARILVVDDDPAVLTCVARQLARWGHTVVRVGSANAAAAVLASDEVDVLVSDLQMPEMDGFTLAARTHATAPRLPVIIMSGSFHEIGVREPGGIALVPKGQMPGALQIAVERALKRLGSPMVS